MDSLYLGIYIYIEMYTCMSTYAKQNFVTIGILIRTELKGFREQWVTVVL